jgi:hypothetical protein
MCVRFCASQDSRVRADRVLHSHNRLCGMRQVARTQINMQIMNSVLWFVCQFSLFMEIVRKSDVYCCQFSTNRCLSFLHQHFTTQTKNVGKSPAVRWKSGAINWIWDDAGLLVADVVSASRSRTTPRLVSVSEQHHSRAAIRLLLGEVTILPLTVRRSVLQTDSP